MTCMMTKNTIQALLLVVPLLLFSCQSDPTDSDQYKQLEQDKDRQVELNQQKDSTINDLFESFNRISDNIRAIRQKQGGLSVESLGVESGENMEEKIMGDLLSIDQLLDENKALIAKLKKSARGNEVKINSLERTIASLEALVADKDAEIGMLKDQLSSANSSLAVMIEMYREQNQLVESQGDELNTAYYAFGTAKELKDNGIISKTGGLAGIGGSKTINMSGLNKDYFQKIDISEVSSIPIMAKKAKMITSHPDGSYEFDGEVDHIRIKDPKAFWSVSKYLVIQVN